MVDLRLGIRRADRPGVGTHVIRFQGRFLVSDGEISVYLTPKPALVFYRDPKYGSDGQYWVFPSLGSAAAATDVNGQPQFNRRILQLVAAGLGHGREAPGIVSDAKEGCAPRDGIFTGAAPAPG